MEKKQNFQNISQAIRSKKETIIKEWETELRQTVDVAKKETSAILRDHLPGVLENMAQAFDKEMEGEKRLENTFQMANEHGKQRAMQTDFELLELIKEYNILRRTCLKHIFPSGSEGLEGPLKFHEYIDSSITTSVNSFVQLQKTALQNEINLREKFVTAMSHDLRTPLAAVKMSAQIILRKHETPDIILKHIPRIVSNIDRMDFMIRDILDATMIKSGRTVPMQLEVCNLVKVAEDTIYDLISIHGQRFVFVTPEEDIVGTWSHLSLRRILENLCNNAIKYGSQVGLVTVSVTKSDNETVTLSVHNEGKPIADEEIQDLFNEYQRSRDAIDSKHHGWGIGLTLVKGLVEAHGGSIRVETKTKPGTTFIISLPIDSKPFVK